MTRSILTAAAALAVFAAAGAVAVAHDAASLEYEGDKPPQVERWELMDEVGNNAQTLGDMAKGDIAYDAEQAREALQVIAENGERFLDLFPEGTETGHDTRALPTIWSDREGFERIGNDMVEAANAAVERTGEDFDAFRTAFRDVGQTCRACHQDYRAEKN